MAEINQIVFPKSVRPHRGYTHQPNINATLNNVTYEGLLFDCRSAHGISSTARATNVVIKDCFFGGYGGNFECIRLLGGGEKLFIFDNIFAGGVRAIVLEGYWSGVYIFNNRIINKWGTSGAFSKIQFRHVKGYGEIRTWRNRILMEATEEPFAPNFQDKDTISHINAQGSAYYPIICEENWIQGHSSAWISAEGGGIMVEAGSSGGGPGREGKCAWITVRNNKGRNTGNYWVRVASGYDITVEGNIAIMYPANREMNRYMYGGFTDEAIEPEWSSPLKWEDDELYRVLWKNNRGLFYNFSQSSPSNGFRRTFGGSFSTNANGDLGNTTNTTGVNMTFEGNNFLDTTITDRDIFPLDFMNHKWFGTQESIVLNTSIKADNTRHKADSLLVTVDKV